MDCPQIRSHLSSIEELMQNTLNAEDERIYGLLAPYVMRGGKRIRPMLALLTCGATGGKYESVTEAAAIIELFHNFTLIHDDIEDDSQFRRGKPTLHITHGLPMALNSGDALYTLIWKKIVSLDLEPKKLLELQRLYANAFKKVVDGQGIEISWIQSDKFDVSEEEYFQMIGGKTSALIGLSCELGALFGGNNNLNFREFGENIGAAFQIHDDVLNVTGDFEKYQKEIGGDISEGKRTLMVVHCLKNASEEDKERLISILRSHSKDKKEIDEAISLLRKHGSVDYARQYSINLVKESKAAIEKLPDSPDKQSLLSLADYVISREL